MNCAVRKGHFGNFGDFFDRFEDIFFNFGKGHGQHHLPATQLNATLDPTATDGNHHALTGSGISDTGWQKQEIGHNEVAINVGYRTGGFIQPTAVEHNGALDFTGRAGTQVIDLAHNVSTARADRGAMAEGWSFDTGANGPGGMTQQQFLASGGHEQIKIDLDPGAGFKWLWLDAKYDSVHNPGGSHVVWTAHDNTFVPKGTIMVADDGGNAYTTQNTTNLAFFKQFIDVDPHHGGIQTGGIAPAGSYGFEAIMTDAHNHTIASIHADLHLV